MINKTSVLYIILMALLSSCGQHDRYVLIQGYAQGGTYSVKYKTLGKDGRIRLSPEEVRFAVDSILESIDNTLSGYNKGSLLSRLNSGDTIEFTPGGMLDEIYGMAASFYEETDGALDVAAGPLFDIWGFGFTTDSMPSPDKVRETAASCGMGRLKKDMKQAARNGRVDAACLLGTNAGNTSAARGEKTPEPTLPVLNFNAIAQGYSCDLVARYLYGIGVKDMLVDIGEIFCDGVNPAGRPWRVGIDRPFDGNDTPGQDLDGIWESPSAPCGIVTSGNYRKFYVRDGHKYSHTIDPRTGYPVEHNLLSATITAPTATEADAYATYCMVIGLDNAKQFISDNAGRLTGYLIYSDEDGNMCEWASEGFSIAGQ